MDETYLYVDKKGNLWRGWMDTDDNLHYARFAGLTNGSKAGVVKPIWILERSEVDRDNWIRIGTVPSEFLTI